MAARNLSYLMSLLGLRVEIIHTLDQLTSHPLTQAFVPVFIELRDGWTVTFGEELALRDATSGVNARVAAIDMTLNSLASRTSKAILNLTDDDRTHPMYRSYFKGKSLCDFKRPVLGDKYKAVAGWVSQLKTSGVPELMELSDPVGAAVKVAGEAVKTRNDLATQSTIFREVGVRKQFFDKVNAVRKETYGALAKMPYENIGLPSNFADLFFRHETGRGDEPATLEAMDKDIQELEAELAQKREARKAREAELAAQEEAKKGAEKAAKLAVIAKLEKAADEAAQKAAEARAKIAELSQ